MAAPQEEFRSGTGIPPTRDDDPDPTWYDRPTGTTIGDFLGDIDAGSEVSMREAAMAFRSITGWPPA